ncbi:MAG: hypothetical protein J7K53_03300 [Bacteroidales bacterium]|nr:hypothetical protein [Bacteroidales bacterium]
MTKIYYEKKSNHYKLFIILIFLFQTSRLFCQPDFEVSTPRLFFVENRLTIEYDIFNSISKNLFNVWVVITDDTGNSLDPVSLSGDVGEKVPGGINKTITWDIEKDQVLLNQEIFVEVRIEDITRRVRKKEIFLDNTTTPFKKGGLIFTSTLLPGTGLTKINYGKPFWLIGIAGYGCIASSIVFNKKAADNYESYLNSFDITESRDFYDKSQDQDRSSKILVYTAIGIWVADLIWVTTSVNKKNKIILLRKNQSFLIKPDIDRYSNSPLIKLSYRF